MFNRKVRKVSQQLARRPKISIKVLKNLTIKMAQKTHGCILLSSKAQNEIFREDINTT